MYNRALPRPTSSGTLENDVKRQKIDRPSPYYYPQYQYGHPAFMTAAVPAPASSPAPYYSPPPLPATYESYWNQPVYPPPNLPYAATPQALAPAQDSPVPTTIEGPKKAPLKKNQSFADSDEEDNEEEEEEEEGSNEGSNEGNGNQSTSTIQGTSITLATEEDIAKWREERKKMWLLKISNKRKEHMEKMGIKEEELKGSSVLQETKKQKQFIQNIQNQVNRINPKANLNVKIVQREMAQENLQLLQFIKELGDSHLLEYELTPEEKSRLFGSPEDKQKNAKKPYIRNNNHTGNTRKR